MSCVARWFFIGLGLLAFAANAGAQRMSKKKVQRMLGVPSQQWACPKEGAELRFRNRVARRHATSHKLGRCFQVIEKQEGDVYKLWIGAVDAAIVVLFQESDLAPVVKQRQRLEALSEAPAKQTMMRPGIYVDAGTPVTVLRQPESMYVESDRPVTPVQETTELVQIELPTGDIVGSGWMPTTNLGTTGHKKRQRRARSGRRISIPGRVDLLNGPAGKRIASIASAEEFVTAVSMEQRDDHLLISYQGEHATVIGWILASAATHGHEPNSDVEMGLARIEDTLFWIGAGEKIYDRPSGEDIGVFIRDTEVVGRALKNGWVQLPLATELGTLNLWSPVYSKHAIR